MHPDGHLGSNRYRQLITAFEYRSSAVPCEPLVSSTRDRRGTLPTDADAIGESTR